MGELQVSGLTKRLGDHLAVDEVSFAVEEGEFFVLLGPSGGGKSTLLRLICGLETPDAGAIILNGRDITRLPPRERNLGMVFQDYGLYPNMNVFDNIAYGLQAKSVPRAEIDKRVPDAAEKLGLADFLRRAITDMSGGEQQRVALARAMVKDADCYLYDEPLSNLDPKLRFKARHDIMKVHRLKRQPSLYVTHDQSEAFTMADRIAVIGGGRLQQVGVPDELLHRPANLFMARFIGSPTMNLLRGKLERSGEDTSFAGDGLTITLPQHFNRALYDYSSEHIVLGIRPEAIMRAGSPGEVELGEAGSLQAEVTEAEPLVGETAVMLKLGAASKLYAVFDDADDSVISVGERLELSFDPERICLFDPHSEQALAA
jgi:ABC-type sugar transport system ATPase subunit